MKVKFLPEGSEFEIKEGQSILELARQNGVYIKSVCNGMPSCAECRIQIVEGEHNTLPPARKELDLLGTGHFIDQRRLACQLTCYGDVTINLEEQIQKEKDKQDRRPHGNLKRESTEESRAITGNLIDQDQDLVKEAETDVEESGAESQKAFYDKSGEDSRKKRNSSRNKHRNKNRNRNNRNNKKASSSGSEANSSESSGRKKKSNSQKKRRRNNNQRRNKKSNKNES